MSENQEQQTAQQQQQVQQPNFEVKREQRHDQQKEEDQDSHMVDQQQHFEDQNQSLAILKVEDSHQVHSQMRMKVEQVASQYNKDHQINAQQQDAEMEENNASGMDSRNKFEGGQQEQLMDQRNMIADQICEGEMGEEFQENKINQKGIDSNNGIMHGTLSAADSHAYQVNPESHQQQEGQCQQQMPNLQQQQQQDSDDEGVISTSVRNIQQTPYQSKQNSVSGVNVNNNGLSQQRLSQQNLSPGMGNIQGLQGSSGISNGQSAMYQGSQSTPATAKTIKAFLDNIKKGDIQLVKTEMEKLGLDITNLYDENYRHNAIFYALNIKDPNLSQKMIEFLTSLGVDSTANDSLNQTPLFYASRDGRALLVEYFLKQGCLPNHIDTNGQTSIFYAAREGHLEVCKKLVQCGADCDLVDNNGQTPIYYAARGRKYDTVQFLIQNGADVNHEDKKFQTPLMIAKRTNAQQIVNLLIAHGAKAIDDLRKQKKQKNLTQTPALQEPSQIQNQQTQNMNSSNLKKNPPTGGQERKQAKRYVLTVLKDGAWEPLSNEELDKFEAQYPDIAKFWKEQSNLDQLQLPRFPENAPIYESWDKAAKRLISTIWKFSSSWIFHEPVDPVKHGVPDYFNVIKNPMDFGTIRQRLNSNYYHRMQEFLDDMQLVFDNCLKFNGDDTSVGKICKGVRDEFKRLYDQLNIEFYLN